MKEVNVNIRENEIFGRTMLSAEYAGAKMALREDSEAVYRRVGMVEADGRWLRESLEQELPAAVAWMGGFVGGYYVGDDSFEVSFIVGDGFPEGMQPVLKSLLANHLVERINRRWLALTAGRDDSAFGETECLASLLHLLQTCGLASVSRRPYFPL